MVAAVNGCRESVETLLQLEADPNKGEFCALYCALHVGDQAITERLAPITTKGEAHRGQLVMRLVTAFRIITMFEEII